MKEIFTIIIITIIVLLGANVLSEQICLKSYSDYKADYSFFSGCRINYNGKLTPVDMIKNIKLN